MIQFAHIEYSITTRSLDIFSIGCDGFCEGCFNTEVKDWNLDGMSSEQVLKKVDELNTKFDKLIDKILLLGGDQCDLFKRNPIETTKYLKKLKEIVGDKPLFLFTRHEIANIPKELLELVDYVKTGAYIPTLKCENNVQENIKLATSNQKIIKLR